MLWYYEKSCGLYNGCREISLIFEKKIASLLFLFSEKNFDKVISRGVPSCYLIERKGFFEEENMLANFL